MAARGCDTTLPFTGASTTLNSVSFDVAVMSRFGVPAGNGWGEVLVSLSLFSETPAYSPDGAAYVVGRPDPNFGAGAVGANPGKAVVDAGASAAGCLVVTILKFPIRKGIAATDHRHVESVLGVPLKTGDVFVYHADYMSNVPNVALDVEIQCVFNYVS